MRRAIVHIGMPRTGSSTFQFVLWHRREELEKLGILYPDLTPRSAAQTPHMSHQHLGEAMDGRRPRSEGRELLDKLSDRLAETACDTVVISYEDFIQEKRAGAIAARLRATFDRHGFEMRAVVAAKPQAEHLNSIYSHRMQMMLERRLFAEFVPLFKRSKRFDYGGLLEPWLVACAGRVQGVPIRDLRSPAPLVRRLLEAAGLDDRVGPLLLPDDLVRVENRSPGPVAVEVSRRLRSIRVHARLATTPRTMMNAVDVMARERGLDRVPFKGVGPELRAEMAALYANTNDRFAQALWDRPWSAVVAPEPVHPVNEIGTGLIAPDTEDAIETIAAEACRSFGVRRNRPWTAPFVEQATDAGGWLERKLRLSKWRVA